VTFADLHRNVLAHTIGYEMRRRLVAATQVVFLFDVDNTLLDNDRVTADLKRHLEQTVGHERQENYWAIFERLRTELGYADYLGALQRFRVEHPRDPQVLTVSHFLVNYPFANRLFPNALDAVEHVKQWRKAVILSDGDVVFQPRKIERSGLFEAVDNHVLVDDKLRILTAVKKIWGPRVTTVFPRQGHYAHDPHLLKNYPPADVTIDRIGDVLRYDLPQLVGASAREP
jgi:phosphoserine phosphatase